MFAGKNLYTASALICVALVTGCAKRDNFTVGSVPSDYRTAHPIVIAEKEQTLDIPVAAGADKLSNASISNVKAFASGFASSGSGTMIVLMPAGSPNASAAQYVQGQIVEALNDETSERVNVIVQTYDASQHGAAPIRLSYRAIKASTNKCGQWTDDLTHTAENKNYADFGCSTQSNLAAQVANPGDFLGPRAESPIDAANRSKVIEAYQTKK